MWYINGIDGPQLKGSFRALQHHRKAVKPYEQSVRFPFGSCTRAIKTYENTMKDTDIGQQLLSVSQIMSSPVLTIGRYQSTYSAWRLLKEGNVRQLVVTSKKNEVIGLLADLDILQHINVENGEVEMNRILPVADVLHTEIFTTASNSDIRHVAGLMVDHHINAIAIVEKKRAIGIVSRGDILKYFAENPKQLNLWA